MCCVSCRAERCLAATWPLQYTRIHTPGASLGGRVSPDECLRDIAHLSAFAPCGYARCGCLRCRVRGSFLSFSAVYGSCAVSQILSLCAPRSAPSALSIFARPRCIIHSTRPLSKCRVVCEHRPPERGRKEGAAGGCRWHCRVRRGTLETVASYSTVSCLSEFPALVSCVYRRSLGDRATCPVLTLQVRRVHSALTRRADTRLTSTATLARSKWLK